jgi:TolC family type I secretion outer membrane protein
MRTKLATLATALTLSVSTALADLADPFATGDLTAKSQAASINKPIMLSPCGFSNTGKAPLSLPDVVERALCNNPQTREAWANARAQAAQVGVSGSAYLPSINATGSLTHNETSSTTYNQHNVGLSLGYLLYDFGGRDATLENAKQVLAALNATQDTTIQSVFLSAVQAYYQLFATQAAVDSTKEAEKSSLESFNAAAARYGVGAGTPADKLQAQTAYSQAVLNRIRAEGDAKNAQGSLANVMGLDANQALEIVPPLARTPDAQFEGDVARLIDEARKNRPDLAAAEAQIKAAQANVEAVQASGMPSISLTTNLNHDDTTISSTTNSSSLGVSVSIPLFTGFNTTYRTQAAQAQVETRMAQRDRLSQQVALDVWRAYQGLITQTQSLKTSADLVASASQSERVALGRYKAGVGNILDVLTAQSALASARQQNIQALYGWYTARSTLAQAVGQLDFTTIDSSQR